MSIIFNQHSIMTSYEKLKEECMLLRLQLEEKELQLKNSLPTVEEYKYPGLNYSLSEEVSKHYAMRVVPEMSSKVKYFESKNVSKHTFEEFKLVWKQIYPKLSQCKFSPYIGVSFDKTYYAVTLYCKLKNIKYGKTGLEMRTRMSDIISSLPIEFYQFNLIVFESSQGLAYPA